MRVRKIQLQALAAASQIFFSDTASAQYTVLPQGPLLRGHLWIGDGMAQIYSSNVSLANRLRVGGELQFGEDYQYVLGLTLLDEFFSGETSQSVGDIKRSGFGLNFGYFVFPERLWLMYSLQFQNVSSNGVIGSVNPLGHQVSIGYRVYSTGNLSVSLEGAYQFIPSYNASTLNYSTGASGTASFPQASIWSLNFRLGFDTGTW